MVLLKKFVESFLLNELILGSRKKKNIRRRIIFHIEVQFIGRNVLKNIV